MRAAPWLLEMGAAGSRDGKNWEKCKTQHASDHKPQRALPRHLTQAPMPLANILITGTPGTGKTSLAEAAAAALGLTHVDVGKAIREQELHSGWDEEFECVIVDEDKARRLAAEARAGLRPRAGVRRPGGADERRRERGGLPQLRLLPRAVRRPRLTLWPSLTRRSWFDLVLVLQADNSVLYERLHKRRDWGPAVAARPLTSRLAAGTLPRS